MPAYVSEALRARVAAADHHRCAYCLTAEAISGLALTAACDVDRTPPRIDHLGPAAGRKETRIMTIKRTARVAAFLLIAALTAWAAYLVIAGVPYTSYAEVQPGQTLGPAQTLYMAYYPALYSPLVLLLVIGGLIRDRWLPLAWVGLLLHLALGGLLIFSFGILYIAATGVLATLAGIIEWQATGRARWLLAAGTGAALVLLIGAVMLGTTYGYPLLAAGLLLGGSITVLWTGRRHLM